MIYEVLMSTVETFERNTMIRPREKTKKMLIQDEVHAPDEEEQAGGMLECGKQPGQDGSRQ